MTSGEIAPGNRVGQGGLALVRGAVLTGLALVELVLFVLSVVAGSLLGVGIGLFLLPPLVAGTRRVLNLQRRLAREWSGVEIPVPYVRPPLDNSALRKCHWVLGDRASWRDALWLLLDPCLAVLLPFLPVALVLDGLRGLLMPLVAGSPIQDWLGNWYGLLPVSGPASAWLAAVLGLAHFPLAVWLAPYLLQTHARAANLLLTPSRSTLLANRIQYLTETRESAVGRQAGELRRIERNLHDGAQARLVAMGMTLDAAVRVLETHPEAAKSLLEEAKTNSAKALQELRDLVRGIQPPVLVDRGLGDAIRTLAMENPLRIDTDIDLPGRLRPAVEAAAYFSVSEILNNAMKHSGAESGRIDLRHREGRLVIGISDDGRGGADPSHGTGLRGIERRLAPFDGFITVLSPLGGPTLVTVEIPCQLTVRKR